MSVPLYLACGPAERGAAAASGRPLCLVGPRLAPDGTGLLEPELPPGARADWVLLPDEGLGAYRPADAAVLLLRYCRARGCGLLADFGTGSPAEAAEALTALDAAFAAAGVPMAVPEYYAEAAPGSLALISSALSGGFFASRVRECAARRPGRCALELEPVRADFALPCPDGCGRPIGEAELAERRAAAGRDFLSAELLCRYFTREEDGKLVFTLFDDAETLRAKLGEAERAGFVCAFGLFQELRGLL